MTNINHELANALRDLIFEIENEYGQAAQSAQFSSILSDAIYTLEKATGETLTGIYTDSKEALQ